MTKREFNYTGRQTIKREHVAIQLSPNGDAIDVGGKVNLADYEVPNASVIVDVYRRLQRFRISCGGSQNVVGIRGQVPAFEDPEILLCDVKIVSEEPGKKGLILASATKVRPTLEGATSGTSGVLPFKPSWDLGQLLWKLAIEDDNPVVYINAGLDDWNSFCRSTAFKLIALPEITRGICAWIWPLVKRYGDTLAEEVPCANDWVIVLDDLGVNPMTAVGAGEDQEAWTDEVCQALCDRQKVLDKWKSLHEQEQGQ